MPNLYSSPQIEFSIWWSRKVRQRKWREEKLAKIFDPGQVVYQFCHIICLWWVCWTSGRSTPGARSQDTSACTHSRLRSCWVSTGKTSCEWSLHRRRNNLQPVGTVSVFDGTARFASDSSPNTYNTSWGRSRTPHTRRNNLQHFQRVRSHKTSGQLLSTLEIHLCCRQL